MKSFNIITDSSSDLPKDIYVKNNIFVESFTISVNEKEFEDGTLPVQELFTLAEKEKAVPKTAAVSPVQLLNVFEMIASKGEKAIYLGLGSGFSSSYQHAKIASEEFKDQIYVVDSDNLSSGVGILLLKLIKFRDEGMNVEDAVTNIEKMKKKVKTQFAISTLEYLHRGGRCSGTARFFGTLLKIFPIIRVVNGEMVVAKKGRGKYENSLDILVDYFVEDFKENNVDLDYVMVTHVHAPQDYIYLSDKLTKKGVKNILETNAGCTIATHCGLRTIGIIYIVKE